MHFKATKFLKNSFLLTLDAGIAAVFTGIFWLLAARIINVTEVGIATTVISACSLLALFSRLGFDYGIPYFYTKIADKPRLIYTLLTISIVTALSLSLLFLASLNIWLPELHFLINSPFWIVIFCLITICLVLINLFLNTAIASDRIIWVVIQDSIQNAGRILIWGIFLLNGRGLSAQYLLISFLISALGSILIGYWKIAPSRVGRTIFFYQSDIFKKVRSYTLKTFGSTLLITAPGLILPLIITSQLGPEKTAVFSICWMFLQAIIIIHSAFTSLSFNEGSKDIKSLKDRFPLIVYANWGVLAVLAGGILVLGYFALSLFGQIYAEQGYLLLLIITFATFFSSLNDYSVVIHRLLNQMRPVYLFVGSSSFGLILLSILLINHFGLLGVGYAYLVTNVTIAVVAMLVDQFHPLKKSLYANV